jgi:hypothetical protein
MVYLNHEMSIASRNATQLVFGIAGGQHQCPTRKGLSDFSRL